MGNCTNYFACFPLDERFTRMLRVRQSRLDLSARIHVVSTAGTFLNHETLGGSPRLARQVS